MVSVFLVSIHFCFLGDPSPSLAGRMNIELPIPYATHGAGILTYKTGWFLGQMLVNIPYNFVRANVGKYTKIHGLHMGTYECKMFFSQPKTWIFVGTISSHVADDQRISEQLDFFTRVDGSSQKKYMGMGQCLLIQFLMGWTSIYQLFSCSPGVQGFDTLPYLGDLGEAS